jgi:hypothetical protein
MIDMQDLDRDVCWERLLFLSHFYWIDSKRVDGHF